MSGKVKGAPKSPEEERAELRQLTRELHEAAQAARGAARELRDARQEVRDTAQAMIVELVVPLVNEAVTDVNAHFDTGLLAVRDKFAEADAACAKMARDTRACAELIEKKAMDTEARLAGFADRGDALAVLVSSIQGTVATLAREPEFISDVAVKISESVGALMAAEHPREHRHMKSRARGQVLVGTQEQLDAYMAAGGDPGIVLRG